MANISGTRSQAGDSPDPEADGVEDGDRLPHPGAHVPGQIPRIAAPALGDHLIRDVQIRRLFSHKTMRSGQPLPLGRMSKQHPPLRFLGKSTLQPAAATSGCRRRPCRDWRWKLARRPRTARRSQRTPSESSRPRRRIRSRLGVLLEAGFGGVHILGEVVGRRIVQLDAVILGEVLQAPCRSRRCGSSSPWRARRWPRLREPFF